MFQSYTARRVAISISHSSGLVSLRGCSIIPELFLTDVDRQMLLSLNLLPLCSPLFPRLEPQPLNSVAPRSLRQNAFFLLSL